MFCMRERQVVALMAGRTVRLESGAGPAYDLVITRMAANATRVYAVLPGIIRGLVGILNAHPVNSRVTFIAFQRGGKVGARLSSGYDAIMAATTTSDCTRMVEGCR